MMSENPLVSILVLNYNGKRFLKDCFESVLKSTYDNFEVILVDNHSTDDSREYTKENFPEVKIFDTQSNAGYSRAYNLSFEVAKGKYVVLLNNDVSVEPDWLEPLVDAAEKDDSIGALQPKIVSMVDPGNFEYAGASGGFMDKYGFPFLRGRVFDHMEKDEGQYNDVVEIFWASGAALFLRKEIINQTGGLDEEFVHHMEEIDLCYRINLADYKIKVIPKSKIYHFGGATITPDSYKKMYWNHRNSVLMLLQNLEAKNIPGILFFRFLLDHLAMAQSLLKLNSRVFAIIAAYWWILFHLPMVYRKRKQVKALRKISDKELFKKLYPKSIALQYFLKGKKTYNQLIAN